MDTRELISRVIAGLIVMTLSEQDDLFVKVGEHTHEEHISV